MPQQKFEYQLNEQGPPRRGAFEISVYKSQQKPSDASLIWTGIKRGPPRREKFPESNALVTDIQKVLAAK